MSDDALLLFDLGTGNSRVALVSPAGDILGVRSWTNQYQRDESYPDATWFDPAAWRAQMFAAARAVLEEVSAHVVAVSAAAARQSFVVLDAAGQPIIGLPNIDNRGKQFMDRYGPADEIYRLSGKWVTEDFGVAKLVGWREHYGDDFARAAHVVSMSEWLAAEFTGRVVMEPSHGCEFQLLDIEAIAWSDRLCELYDVPRALLPELAAAGTDLGPVRPEVLSHPSLADAHFLVGGADTQLAIRLVGAPRGATVVVSGTTTPVSIGMDTCLHDPQQRVWTDVDLGGHGYQVEANPGVTGLNFQRLKQALAPDLDYPELEAALSAKTRSICTASFTTLQFTEARSTRTGGFFCGAPIDPEWDRIDMLWAVLADTACATAVQIRNLREVCGTGHDGLYGCGGGLQSGVLTQMIADLTGEPLRLRAGYEQATLAGLAAVCSGALGIHTDHQTWLVEPRPGSLVRQHQPRWQATRDVVTSH